MDDWHRLILGKSGMNAEWVIRELRDGDVEAFVELWREALLDSPLAFVASPSDDRFSAPETVREQFSCLTASPILFRNSSWLISLRMQPRTASEIARGTEDRQDAGGRPLSLGQPGLRMIMRIARHRCCVPFRCIAVFYSGQRNSVRNWSEPGLSVFSVSLS